MSAVLRVACTGPIDDAVCQAAAEPGTHWLGGGTELLPWLRAGAVTARRLLPVAALHDERLGRIARIDTDRGPCLELGAAVTLADAAAHPSVRQQAPLVAEALRQTASPQVRNLATLAGNLLQQHRCPYWRQGSAQCDRVRPGAGCAARLGEHRHAALFGLGDADPCIAAHASDLAVALWALEAQVTVRMPGPSGAGEQLLPVVDLLRRPSPAQPWPCALPAGALITTLRVPVDSTPHVRRIRSFQKLRDRASFQFALVSLALALDLHDGVVRRARLVAGGVAPLPWRLEAAERCLEGVPARGALWRAAVDAAAAAAVQGATPRPGNAFKVELLARLVRHGLRLVDDAVEPGPAQDPGGAATAGAGA